MKITTLAAAGLVLLALAVPFASALQEPSTGRPTDAWEYKVVGLSDLHGSTLEYLKQALTEEGGLLGKAKAADEQLARKTEDLLNELGDDGWELIHYSTTSIILQRPGR